MDGIYTQLVAVIILFSILGCLLLGARRAGLVRWNLRAPSTQMQAVTVLQRLVLTPNHTAHLIQVGTRQLLIGCSPQSCQVIADVTDVAEQLSEGGK